MRILFVRWFSGLVCLVCSLAFLLSCSIAVFLSDLALLLQLKSRFLTLRGPSWELKINLEKLQEEKKRPEKKIKNHFEAVRG